MGNNINNNHVESFWVSNPNDLNLLKFWPCANVSTEGNMNRLTVLFIYISVVSSLISKSYTPLYIGILGIAGIAVIYYMKYAPNTDFFNGSQKPRNVIDTQRRAVVRSPTVNNPFMNVEVTDYDKPQTLEENSYDNVIYQTPSTRNVKKQVNDTFTNSLFQDPSGKLFERNNSQRQYVSQPVGSVPSKQNEFAQWLYGKDGVCKSGSIWDRYGLETTPDSMLCTGFNSSSPTNFGKMDK
jgi:hypothetical protein